MYGNVPEDYEGTDLTGVNGNIAADPSVVSYDPLVLPTTWDLHLAAGSPAIDAGNPATFDPDGSVADMGVYGGPGADAW